MKNKNIHKVNKPKKVQKREVIIKEYEDGLFEMECPLFWKLEKIPKKEIDGLCFAWVKGELENKKPNKIDGIELGPPRSFKI